MGDNGVALSPKSREISGGPLGLYLFPEESQVATKKKNKLSKKELKEKDQILTNLEKGWNLLEKHSVKVVGVLIGGVVVTGIWAIWGHFSHKSDAEASRMFNQALRAYNTPVIPESPDGKETKKGKKEPESYPTAEKRAKAALALFKKLSAEHGDNRLANVARFYMGNCHFQLKAFDKAIKQYKKFLSGGGSGCSGGSEALSPALKLMALENLAYSFEGKKDYDKALSYFSRLEKAESGLKKEWSIYHQARMWEKKGEIKKAIRLYKSVKVADAHAAMSPLRSIAERRALYLQNGLGEPPAKAPRKAAPDTAPETDSSKARNTTGETTGETRDEPPREAAGDTTGESADKTIDTTSREAARQPAAQRPTDRGAARRPARRRPTATRRPTARAPRARVRKTRAPSRESTGSPPRTSARPR